MFDTNNRSLSAREAVLFYFDTRLLRNMNLVISKKLVACLLIATSSAFVPQSRFHAGLSHTELQIRKDRDMVYGSDGVSSMSYGEDDSDEDDYAKG